MNDQLGPAIESWLKATDPVPGDIGRATAAIEAETAATSQRGRWWPPPASLPRLTGPGRPRRQTMFSALKLFAAGVIVALFGGLLFAGFSASPSQEQAPAAIATASDSPEPATAPPAQAPEATVTPTATAAPAAPRPELRGDLAPGVELLAQEVDPGVFRIVNDGVRHPSLPALGPDDFVFHPWGGNHDELFTGLDGSVWFKEDGGLTKLGERGSWDLPGNSGGVGVSRDGTLWAVRWARPRIYTHDDGEWQMRFDGRDVAKTISLRLTADDDVWALLGTDRPGRYRLRHYDGTEWVKLPRPPAPADLPEARLEAWDVGDDGTSWAIRRGLISWFDGERWAVKLPYEHDPLAFRQMPDGRVLSLRHDEGGAAVDSFAADGSSERLTIPPFGDWGPPDYPVVWTLAPDGAVWRSLVKTSWWGAGPYAPHFSDCAGLARFDGETWTSYLPGRCVAEIEFGPDGSVWTYAATASPGETLVADGSVEGIPAGTEIQTLVDGPLELYVITPEGVAAG